MSNWLAEDPELLRAALEIIDTWDEGDNAISVHSPLTDGSESSSGGEHLELDESSGDDASSVNEPTPASGSLMVTMRLPPLDVKPLVSTALTTRRELKPSTVASTRHRRREEIIYLRDKVKEMEANLAALQHMKKEEDGKTSQQNADKALAAMWHDIAVRQHRMRQKSELDQVKLRTLLETQVKVAQGLMKLMQKARRMEDEEVLGQSKRMRLTGTPSARIDEAEHLTRVDNNYAQLGAMFTFPKFHDGSTKFVDIEVNDTQEDVVIIEYREAWAVPFEADRVLDALWEYTLKKNKEKWHKPGTGCMTTTQDEEGKVFVSHFLASMTLGEFTGSFHGQVVIKRFPGDTEQSPAIIASMCSEPDPTTPGDAQDMIMHDDTWIRVQPGPTVFVHETSNHHVTSVQVSQRFVMRFGEESTNGRKVAGLVTNMLLDKLKDEIERKHETVETLLLQSRTGST